jgi:antitoxin MazE
METVVRKWGNSKGILLPKAALNIANFKEQDKLEISARENEIIIKKAGFVHRTLEERLDGYAEIYVTDEYDSSAVGEERFWKNIPRQGNSEEGGIY